MIDVPVVKERLVRPENLRLLLDIAALNDPLAAKCGADGIAILLASKWAARVELVRIGGLLRLKDNLQSSATEVNLSSAASINCIVRDSNGRHVRYRGSIVDNYTYLSTLLHFLLLIHILLTGGYIMSSFFSWYPLSTQHSVFSPLSSSQNGVERNLCARPNSTNQGRSTTPLAGTKSLSQLCLNTQQRLYGVVLHALVKASSFNCWSLQLRVGCHS